MTSEIREGNAQIRFKGDAATFYNPAQEFNRDLTVSVLRLFAKEFEEEQPATTNDANGSVDEPKPKRPRPSVTPGFRILDALSASGLRAIRFAREVPNVTEIIANDFSANAFATIQENVELNKVNNLVSASHADATYGSASPFLDTAVQSVADRGLLMITSTDMATLCGNTPEAALGKYGSTTFKHKSCHEEAIRILLRAVQQRAAAYDRYIEPLLSLSVDFYVRCFVRVHTGAQGAKEGAL